MGRSEWHRKIKGRGLTLRQLGGVDPLPWDCRLEGRFRDRDHSISCAACNCREVGK